MLVVFLLLYILAMVAVCVSLLGVDCLFVFAGVLCLLFNVCCPLFDGFVYRLLCVFFSVCWLSLVIVVVYCLLFVVCCLLSVICIFVVVSCCL